MRRLNFFFSIVFTITLPLMIVILSSTVVLRVSETYNYHFNDSEVLDKIDYSIKGSEMSSAVTSFLSPFNDDKFQAYEVNGKYKDPIFKVDEQDVMKKAKRVLNIELAASIILTAVTIGIYVYFIKNKYKAAIRKRFFIGCGISGALIIANIVCFSIRAFRLWLYNSLIGISLKKTATLTTVLGDPFFKTYVLFTTLLAIIVLGVYIYINHKYTKPDRIFYQRGV